MAISVVPDPNGSRKLNPHEFRVPATDTKGHSVRVYCRCIPAIERRVAEVVEGKSLPYRTKGDVIRHALHRHLQWLEGLGDSIGVRSITGEVDAILEILRDEENNADFLTVFDKLSERLTAHLNRGAEGEARRLLLQVLYHVGRMPDGYWKQYYQDTIKERWGHMIDKKKVGRCQLKMVDLSNGSEEE